jgi:hypothetical protein
MKFAIQITDIDSPEQLAAVTAALVSIGVKPATLTGPKGQRAVAELAAATGATMQTPPPPPTAAPYVPPVPMSPAPDPFATPAAPAMPQPPAPVPHPGATAPTAAPELDSRGVPHNPEFHADSKRKVGNDVWAKRKGVYQDACAAWEAQFTGRTQQPAAPAPAPTAAAPTAAELNAKFAPGLPPQGATVPSADPFATPAIAPEIPPAPMVTAQPAAPQPPAPPAPVAEVRKVSYEQWHSLYSNLLVGGKLSPEKYAEIASRHGAVEDPMKFFENEDARAASYAEFEKLAAA